MTNDEPTSSLRQRAEESARGKAVQSVKNGEDLTLEEARRALHELAVHQIELEMQNEELHRARTELCAERMRYFDLYNLAPTGYLTLSEKGLILEANLTATTLLDVVRWKIVTLPITCFIIPEDHDLFYRYHLQLLETGEQNSCELRMVKRDGAAFWGYLEATAAINSDGTPVCHVILSDITQRKQVEEALRVSERRFREIAENAQDWIWETDTEGKYTYANHVVEKIVGYTSEEILEHYFYDLFHPDERESLKAAALAAFALQKPFRDFFNRNAHKNGQTVWLATSGIPRFDAKGNFLGYRGVDTNITERKQAEDALRASDARYRAVAQSAHDAIVTADSSGNIVGWNHAAERIFGYTEIEASGQPFAMLLPSRFHDGRLGGMAIMQANGEKHVIGKMVEVEGRRKDGSEVSIELSLAEWQVAEGRFTTAIIRDITQRKALEEQFRQVQKLESIGQLAGGVAHDFNNILAVIMIRLSFLQKNACLDPETQELVADMAVDAKRAANLTRQLLLFSRRSVMELELLDLNELVFNLIKMLGRLIGEHIAVQFDRRKIQATVEADAVMLEQVLMNLSVNARDAMPKGGRLTLDIEPVRVDEAQTAENLNARPGQFVCLSVTDTGCGMDEATLKRIFEPFFTTKPIGRGTGLGLATVHGIVAQHKGWLDVKSELGKGTLFKVFLPASTKAILEPTHAEKRAATRGYETILLVEDVANLRQLVAKGLRLLGYRVFEADNGHTAMKLWQEHAHRIDLLFTDMMMPEGMTGLDLAEQMKLEKNNLKVIVSSGYNMEMAGQGSPTAGGIVYFQKPYEFEVLSKTIRDCLDRT
jgi:PAS domain S-box-containing protein